MYIYIYMLVWARSRQTRYIYTCIHMQHVCIDSTWKNASTTVWSSFKLPNGIVQEPFVLIATQAVGSAEKRHILLQQTTKEMKQNMQNMNQNVSKMLSETNSLGMGCGVCIQCTKFSTLSDAWCHALAATSRGNAMSFCKMTKLVWPPLWGARMLQCNYCA